MSYNQLIGELGEDMAVRYLLRHDYKIIARNVKTSYKEIDIIARQGKTTVFIEVKTRTSGAFGGAADALGQKKIRNLKQAMRMYVGGSKIDPDNIRLDLIAIDIKRRDKDTRLKHYRDIF